MHMNGGYFMLMKTYLYRVFQHFSWILFEGIKSYVILCLFIETYCKWMFHVILTLFPVGFLHIDLTHCGLMMSYVDVELVMK